MQLPADKLYSFASFGFFTAEYSVENQSQQCKNDEFASPSVPKRNLM